MKRDKFFRILAVVILLSLLPVVIPATPVLAAPIFSVLPTVGSVGTKVTVTGETFDSYKGDDIYLFFDNQEIATNPITVPQTGNFSFNFSIPAGAKPGRHQIRAESELGSTLALSLFTVLKAGISLDNKAGVVGTTLTINGQGFYANRMISFYYDNRLLGSEAAGGTGEFSYSFTIPDGTAGKHKFAAENVEGHHAEAEFEVLPSITLDATSAAAGSILAVSGSGFGSESSIDVYFGNDEVAYTKTNEFGSFKVTLFNVPRMASGTYDVTAIDEDGNKGGATFTIIAEAATEATAEATTEDKLDEATSPNWGIYILIGVGALVIGILVFWLGRRTTYHQM
ncbi:IPT/TIG domain-containing protein [Chloroflexota bacterium]